MKASQLITILPDRGSAYMAFPTGTMTERPYNVKVDKDSLIFNLTAMVNDRGDFEVPAYTHYTNINGDNSVFIG